MLAPRQDCPSPPFSLLVVKVGSLAASCKNCQNCLCPPAPGQCRGSDQPQCLSPNPPPTMVAYTSVAAVPEAAAWPTVADVAASRASVEPQAAEAVAAASSAAQPAAFATGVLAAPSPATSTVGNLVVSKRKYVYDTEEVTTLP